MDVRHAMLVILGLPFLAAGVWFSWISFNHGCLRYLPTRMVLCGPMNLWLPLLFFMFFGCVLYLWKLWE